MSRHNHAFNPDTTETPPPVTRHRAPPRDEAAAPPVVLLAEDDIELRNLLALKLRRAGCVVLEASTGVELAELIVEHGLDRTTGKYGAAELLVTDIHMPGFTGLEITALLREVDWAMPVIVLTGFGDAKTHAEAKRIGATIFDKPVDLDLIVETACTAVGLEFPTV